MQQSNIFDIIFITKHLSEQFISIFMHIKMVNVDTNFATLLTILFLTCFIYFSIIPTLYGTQANSTKPCNCVIFRMDDIQDYWIEQGQIVPMDLFFI